MKNIDVSPIFGRELFLARGSQMISSQSLSGIGKRFQIGDTAGSGAYVCCRCGEYVAILTGPEDQIPPCENCGSESGVEYVACDAEAEVSHGVDNPR